MPEKYISTDFWYTFINSLYNDGVACGRGELEMDEETQNSLLDYLKEKIEEGVTNGETALPPGLHNYFWRFTEEILPKIQTLVEGILKTVPDNSAASLVQTLLKLADWESQHLSLLDIHLESIQYDPCMNLAIINEYEHRSSLEYFEDFKEEVIILKTLENLYSWAIQQDDNARYQEAKSFYWRHSVTPYTVYKYLKNESQRLKHHLENTGSLKEKTSEIDKYISGIKKCRDLVSLERTAFWNHLDQQQDEQTALVDATSDNMDIWGAYLKSLEDTEKAPSRRLTLDDQDQLLKFLKSRIRDGVVDGKTTLPANIHEHISMFPEVMLMELREFAEEVLETRPDNGAAMKMIAVIVWKGKHICNGESDDDLALLEQAMGLLPNEPEICFDAFKYFDENFDPLFRRSLTALERLFERAIQQDETELYSWVTKLYKDVGRTPCYIYRNLMKNPEENAELITRCKPLIDLMLQSFQQKLAHIPDDWYSLRGIGDIYEVLGKKELSQKYPWEPHTELRWKQKAWIRRKLPNISAIAFDETPISFTDYRGKMLVLDWYAKWCGFCAGEIPHLKDVYEANQQNALDVIGVSLDRNETDLREFTEAHDIPWLQIYDGKGWKSELAQFFGINSIPSQWLIDRDGTIISVDTRGNDLGKWVKWTETTRIGNVISDFSALDVDGNTVSHATLRGKVALLHFGDMHQDPELKHIDTLYKKYHKNGFEAIGINVRGWKNEDGLRGVVRRGDHQGHYIYAARDSKYAALAEQFGFGQGFAAKRMSLPAFILIDRDGTVLDARAEKVHSIEAWAARLEKIVVTHLCL
ncbi:hypothetical protein C6497_03630 [Candidatus Poribacteria bacterium]|nr:MAG: hypothetical protein C6497_03630 [Candidatus Poribacteria bacterium]